MFRPVRTASGETASLWARLTDRSHLVRAAIMGVVFWIGALGVIAPVTARNYAEGGEFVLITAHGGINFHIGNNQDANGWYRTPPGFKGTQVGLVESGRALAEADLGRALDHGEVSDYWFSTAWRFICDHPTVAARLFAKKLFLFWHSYEKPLEGNYYHAQTHSPLLRCLPLGFGLVAPLALLGLFLLLPRWTGKPGLLLLFVLVCMATLVAFFVTSRYRLVALPALLILASYAVWWCIDRMRAGEWKPLALAVALAAVCAVLSNSLFFGTEGQPETDLAYSHYSEGTLLLHRGENEAAIGCFEKAVRLDSNIPFVYGNWGVALANLGRHAEAIDVLETFCRRWPRNPRALYNLASSYHSLAGQDRLRRAELIARARDALQRCLSIDPTHADARALLAACVAE